MSDEVIASPEIEPAPLPIIETEEEVAEETPKDLDNPEADEGVDLEAAEAEEEDEEIEWNGKKFRGPKGLKDGILMQADYTKKTQETSAKAKELESREAEINQRLEATDEELNDRAVLANINSRLSEYAKLTQADWQAHYDRDYIETDRAWRDFQMLKEQRGELSQKLDAKQTERTRAAELDLANRVEATNQFAAKNIKGYSPELTTKLIEFASNEGIDEKTLKANWSPTLYKLIHKAFIGEQTLKQQATPKPKATAPAPLQTIKPAASPTTSKSLAELAKSDDASAYIEARRAQERRAAGRH